MSDAPLVSVIIPVYNGERFLGEALRSVAAQEYRRFEVLVVDDGSTDGSRRIAERFSDVRVLSGPRRGVSGARNLAVAASEGEFLAFLDADDIWFPRKLSLQVALATAQPEVGVVMVLQDYRFEGPIPAWFRGTTDGNAEPGFMPSSWLVRRQCWELVGPFATTMTHGEDIDWLARARHLGVEIGTVQERLLTRRIHDANVSGMPMASRRGLLTALRASIDRKHGAVP
jgi:glycosyltransferase involved in cell wall biosynthesis